jgi:general secretion pathway protein K
MGRRSEEGIALIAVLWALTLLSLIAAALLVETRSSTRVARNMADNAAARAAADAGIQRAILGFNSPDADKEFRVDGTVYNWRFNSITVHISIQDESAKVDLNQATEVLLATLIETVGVEPEKARALAEAIADFRDADNFSRPSGAEEREYRTAGLTWGPTNALFNSVEELQQVLGMTAEIYRRLAPDLTVYSVRDYSVTTEMNGRLREILSRSSLDAPLSTSPGLAFSIRAVAQSTNGAAFIREAIVQPSSKRSTARILSWR